MTALPRLASRPALGAAASRQPRVRAAVEAVWRGVEYLAMAALVLTVAVMILVCLAQVAWRYALNDPLTWSEELARYALVWIGYLSGWLAWRHRAHIALDAIAYLGSPRLEGWSGRLVEALVLGFCGWTFVANMRLLGLTVDQPSAILELPMVYVYLGYSVMAFLICGDVLVTWFVRGGRPINAQATGAQG
ncbi:TRAP transporter small permease [Azospirillum sp. SYSU D00513]|uniref:TRAP transporter small permease n=1 Tax=Azospirillum sp. SYSU D00513 TaxID=2812561 RepID=UPI001A96D834|nr:TRAP transporter small permease [Azospirillum sp. SYSU D00513]